MYKFRVGFGYDVHQLSEGESLIIGGIPIEHDKGTVAHSDGDVLVHAICDALLGAVALGDIGAHFPDNQEQFKNIDSCLLLKETISLIKKHGYLVGNIDCMICLQSPKIASYIEQMKQKLSSILEIENDCISIKATTTEKMGFVGRQEGISSYASVLVLKN